MLKLQISLSVLFISCFNFIGCNTMEKVVKPTTPDVEAVESILNDPDLVVYYSFDIEGNKVPDDSGNGFDAEISGAEWNKDGKFGGAMEFNGSSVIKTPQEIPGLTDVELIEITVEHWVMLNANTGDRQQIWEASTAAGGWPAETFIEGDSSMFFYIYDTQNRRHNLGFSGIPFKKWVHIAGTYDGKVQRVYVNGKVVGETEWSGKITISASTAGAVVLGRDNEEEHKQYLNGFIDEFAFYTRALSEDEINSHMNNGILFPVAPENKLGTTWENIKAKYYSVAG